MMSKSIDVTLDIPDGQRIIAIGVICEVDDNNDHEKFFATLKHMNPHQTKATVNKTLEGLRTMASLLEGQLELADDDALKEFFDGQH